MTERQKRYEKTSKAKARRRRFKRTPRGRYAVHKMNAKRRGVPFLMTFHQWWQLWLDSGKWQQRGNRRGKYCMCRFDDVGPYAIGNVYIGLYDHNTAERNRTVRHKPRHFQDDWSDVPF
jgi:hypothetical protein